MQGTNAMQIFLSRSQTKAHSMEAFVTAVIALIVCSNLAFTGGMENHRAIAHPQSEKEQLKRSTIG
jgi:hypothetical protein